LLAAAVDATLIQLGSQQWRERSRCGQATTAAVGGRDAALWASLLRQFVGFKAR
jgi:hypothetical protein